MHFSSYMEDVRKQGYPGTTQTSHMIMNATLPGTYGPYLDCEKHVEGHGNRPWALLCALGHDTARLLLKNEVGLWENLEETLG